MIRSHESRARGIHSLVVVVFFSVFLGVSTTRLEAAPKKVSVAEAAAEIDRILRETWEASFSEPARPADAYRIFRRLSLDLRGVIPHADEIESFARDRSHDRIAKWTTWFLDTPDFAEGQAQLWEHILIGRKGNPDGLDRGSFRDYLRDAFLANKSYRDLAKEILLSEGTPDSSPGVNFFLRYEGKPEDIAGRVARVFLGTRIECAQCHDHPYADVKREEFYGFAAFFAHTKRFRDYDRAGGNSRDYGIRSEGTKELMMPPMKTGARAIPIKPLYFGDRYKPPANPFTAFHKKGSKKGAKYAKDDRKKMSAGMKGTSKKGYASKPRSDRRRNLAKWLLSKNNKHFARSLVNRVWAQFLGKGFVNPIDDFSEDSKIILPEVLTYLTNDFVTHDYDLRRLMTIIVSTHAYQQRATRGVPGGIVPGEDHDYFASVPIRPLEAETLARSVLRATGMEEPQPEKNARRVRSYVDKARRDFSRRFGVDENEKRMEFQGTVLQVLLLFNGEFTGGKAPASRPFHAEYQKKYPGNIDVVLHGVPPAKQIERLFFATLSRPPSETERTRFEQHLFSAKSDAERQKSLADIQWALLNSAEFLHSS